MARIGHRLTQTQEGAFTEPGVHRAGRYPVLSPYPCSLLGRVAPRDWSQMMSSAHLNPGMGRAREGC